MALEYLVMYRLILTAAVLLLSCEPAKGKRGTDGKVPQDVPKPLVDYVYPGARTDKVFVGRGVSGITMSTRDDLTKVAKFYLDKLGLPDDKVVSSQYVSYLYHVGNRDIIVNIEKSEGRTNVSVSISEGPGR